MAEARAQKKNVQGSPRKMRLMLALIRGKRVTEALSILHFTPNHASIVAEQTLRSAIANFQLKPENARHDVENLVVRECFADGGPMLKRVLPAPMGRAFRVRKRSNHLTIVIGDKPAEKAKAKAAVATTTAVADAPKAKKASKTTAAKTPTAKKSAPKKSAKAVAAAE
jgi:large subunit ribosomal protein L22